MFVEAVDGDLAAIAALMNRAYRGIGGPSGWTSEADIIAGSRASAAFLRSELAARPDARLLQWVVPGEATPGCLWLDPLGDAIWYLGSFAIDPDRQQGGLGRVMLAAAEQWVAARGGMRIRMTVVNVSEALIAWYGRRGYRPTGETQAFPYGDDRYGTPLRDDLYFVVLEKPLAATDRRD